MQLNTFYQSKKWIDLVTQLKLERVSDDGVLYCEHCGKPIVKAYDCIGHHKIELNDANVNDFNVSLNPNNIILIHHKCHNQIHERFGHEQPKKVYCVYGAPCSGKTTWVKENAGVDDLILDVDSIWECISNNERYIKRNRLKQNVFLIRDCILDQIKTRYGKWKHAYIVTGENLESQRDRMRDIYGAEFININTSKEECIKRLHDNPNGRDVETWENYINEYFECN